MESVWGFNLVDNTGRSAVLSRTNVPTQYPVGRYFVNLQSLDSFIDQLFTYDASQLLYIDEVGQIQLHSTNFIKLVEYFMGAENDFVGTISQVYSHPLISKLIEREDVLVCTVTIENRDAIELVLSEALAHRKVFNRLSRHRQEAAIKLARDCISKNHFISLRKLFKNATTYVVNSRIQENNGEFTVNGFTDAHAVKVDQGKLICDCDLFLGRGQFLGQAQQCSHVQAIVIYRSA